MDQNPEKLTCISVIVCDDIHRDERTKKLIIVGTFNLIAPPALPYVLPKIHVLVTLTNGKGRYELSVSIEHEESGEEIVCVNGPLLIDDPLRIADMNIGFANLNLTKSGKYWVTVKSDKEIIQQRPFHVLDRSKAPEQPQREDKE